ncbi:archaeosine biosynthesis radical SAM protein RaSEA ['Paenibacillus yunnanensis' Narsing Rao et al. 2020]|uniref:archaeosine biosynthesis radical SAM protein RaSEA n=1 Tax=Paenibacillus tengchongensis TaxID=2608684 RepID=UPI001652B3FA|nr:archaeosine biosynthesis radical SAM protein RaSEA [Paenibacillus tengchongensis]
MNKQWTANLETLNIQGALNGSRYYRFLGQVMERIHSGIPSQDYNLSRVPTPTDIREENLDGHNVNRAVMYLLTNGCEWALRSGNGCTVCGHLAKQTRDDESLNENDILTQFKDEFYRIDFSNFPILNLYNNGSFFNNREIPENARREILKLINQNQHIRMLVVESRPEYINSEVLEELKVLVPDKKVEVAVGLEMVDDYLRRVCINKGFNLKSYNEKAQLIQKFDLGLRTYVMLKPPFLTEREGVEMAIQTIKHAFATGSCTVSLEACTIQDYTLVQYLYDHGHFTPAWLWSLVEVAKQTAHLGKLVIGLFQFFPSPTQVPYNCDECSQFVLDKIREYNRTLDISVLNNLTCDCKAEWENECNKTYEPFQQRIEVISNFFNSEETKLF